MNVWYHVGLEERAAGPHRVRASVRASDVRRIAASRHGLLSRRCRARARSLNGSTNADRTNYWEVVPSNALELALWMESDRMGYLLPALTDAKFANQRDVVLNERRQNYENRPYGLAPMAMLAALFPPDHPYHWTTIGEIADLHAARLDDVRRFFSTYYHPANASLVARRRHRPRRRARARARRTSATCPAGPSVEPVRPETPPLAGETRLLPRGSRRAAAALSGVADPADVRAGRRRARSRRRHPRQRQDLAAVPAAGVRASGSPPTCRPRRTRARSPASCRSPRPRRPGHSLAELEAVIVEEIAAGWRPTVRPRTKSSAAACRPKRSSCSGCRPSAGSAASPIS